MIEPVLGVVLDHEDDGVLPAWTLGDELDGQPQRRVVVLKESHGIPGRAVRVDVVRAAAMVVRVVQIDVARQLADSGAPVDVLSFEHLLEAPKAAEPIGLFRQGGIGDVCVELGIQVVRPLAHDLLHRDVGVLSDTRGLGQVVLIDEREFEPVSEVDEVVAVAHQMGVDAAVLVEVIGLRRAVGVGEANSARVARDHLGIVARVVLPAAVGGWPVGLLDLRGIGVRQPPVSIRRDGRLEKEVVAEGVPQGQLMMIGTGDRSQRERRAPVDRHTPPGAGDVAEQQIVGRVLLVDEDDVLDLRARDPSAVGQGEIPVVPATLMEVFLVGSRPVSTRGGGQGRDRLERLEAVVPHHLVRPRV